MWNTVIASAIAMLVAYADDAHGVGIPNPAKAAKAIERFLSGSSARVGKAALSPTTLEHIAPAASRWKTETPSLLRITPDPYATASGEPVPSVLGPPAQVTAPHHSGNQAARNGAQDSGKRLSFDPNTLELGIK